MKLTTLAFILWLKKEAELYLCYINRDVVAVILWENKNIFHRAWKASLK